MRGFETTLQELTRRHDYDKKSRWRLFLDKSADAVAGHHTGEQGVFDTRIAFVCPGPHIRNGTPPIPVPPTFTGV
ncbi:MAG: hypothetical protein F4X91_14710 [Nitrospinae bacterium]|nr:hypothetical protein [Nitrospinota bacterium]